MPLARAPRPLRSGGAAVLAAVVAAGCGSASVAELPPPAAPREAPPPAEAPEGRVVAAAEAPPAIARTLAAPGDRVELDAGGTAQVRPRERVVALEGVPGREPEEADAGVGPSRAATNERWLWVTDTQGDALLVFRTRPELELVRRVHLPGGPYAVGLDTEKLRLWVTLTGRNEVVELPAHGRPHVLRRFATVRGPDAVAVATSRVHVAGRDGELQLIDPPPLPRRR